MVAAPYLEDHTQSFAICQPHGFELVIDECKLRAVFGKCWEHTRHPKHSNIFTWRLHLMEMSWNIISMLKKTVLNIAPDYELVF